VTRVVRRHLAASEGTVQGPSQGPGTIPGSASAELQQQWKVVAGHAVKILVRQAGWVRVSQPELLSAGLDPFVDPSRLQLFTGGREVPMLVNWMPNGRFRPSDSIEFYGEGLDTLSTDARAYYLVVGTRPGAHIAVADGTGGWPVGPASFPYELERADRTLYVPALINGDEDNFFGAVITATPVPHTLAVTHLDAAEPATLSVRLQGASSGSHQVAVELNGTRVGTLAWDGLAKGELSIPLTPGMVVAGDNQVTLAAEGGTGDVSLVDALRLAYAHTWEAEGDALACTLDGFQQVTITGFASAGVRVFDVTDPLAPVQVTGQVGASGGGYATTFGAPAAGTRSLLVVGEGSVRPAAAVLATLPTAWHATLAGADLVIVAHRALASALEPLRARRTSQGLKVAVVDVENVYDEFSFGAKGPQAIRDFLAWAKANWLRSPRYLLLVGSASYDPRDYLGLASFDLVPTKLVGTAWMETASDGWFADLNGDGLEDVPVGRLPVATLAQASALVTKLVAYDRTSAPKKVLLLADANDAENNFEAATSSMHTALPPSVSVTDLRRGSLGDPATHTELLAQINLGQTLANYLGHGTVDAWHAGILTAADAAALTNTRLPLVLSMTCLTGYFQDPNQRSLAQALLAAPGGAVAVWASSGLTKLSAQTPADEALLRQLFPASGLPKTLGDATRAAKAAASSTDVRTTWTLFGDPSARLK